MRALAEAAEHPGWQAPDGRHVVPPVRVLSISRPSGGDHKKKPSEDAFGARGSTVSERTHLAGVI